MLAISDHDNAEDWLTVPLMESATALPTVDLTMTAMGGTPRWCAPELYMQSRTTHFTVQQADIYSFAILLFELVTLRTPWDEHRDGIAAWHASAEGKRPKVRPEDEHAAPAELVAMMRACWAAEPAARPTSAEVMHQLRFVVANLEERSV